MVSIGIRRFFVVALFLLGAASPLHAHREIQTNLYLDIELKEEALVYELWVATFQFPALDDIKFEDKENRPTAEERGQAVMDYIDKTCPVEIDGIRVKPVLEFLKYQDMEQAFHLEELRDFVMGRIKWSYPLKARPEQVRMTWGAFVKDPPYGWEGLIDPDQDPKMLDLILTVYKQTDFVRFTPQDPTWVWHAPAELDMLYVADLPELTKPTFPLPLGSVIIAGCGLLFLGITRSKIGVGIAVVALAAAFITKGSMQVDAPKFWAEKAPNLNAKEATETFVKLQQNIYRAFDYQSESDIYDALSQSVEGVLLDRIYAEVYQSLILRDEGGGIAKVQSVDVIDTAAKPVTDAPGGGFDIDCRWRIHGVVAHQQHTHERVNEYQATYRMMPRLDRWKITDVTINEQSRLNPTTLESAEAETTDPQS